MRNYLRHSIVNRSTEDGTILQKVKVAEKCSSPLLCAFQLSSFRVYSGNGVGALRGRELRHHVHELVACAY